MNLYSQHAKEFSDTRQFPWAGWKKLLPYIESLEKVSVLDLGCGNGRFYKFLKEKLNRDFKYTGIDNEQAILDIAASELSEDIELINVDLQSSDWLKKLSKGSEYTLIVAFGLFHHIKSYSRREGLLSEINNLLASKGILVITYWQFEQNLEFLSKHKTSPSDAILEHYNFEPGDYTLTFGEKNIKRFCHSFSNEEIAKMYEELKLEILEEYKSDGFENKMNYYVLARP